MQINSILIKLRMNISKIIFLKVLFFKVTFSDILKNPMPFNRKWKESFEENF